MLSVGGGSAQPGKSPAARARGRRRPPACVAFTASAPGGLCHPYFASRNLRTAKPEPYREHSWAGPTGASLCFLGQPSSRPHTSNTYLHTCRTGNLGAPGQSQGPSVSSMIFGLHSCNTTAALCELPRQRYGKGYCCVFRERRQLYGSLQVDSAPESGRCQSRGSRQL